MALFFLLIQLCLGELEFLSPQELTEIKPIIAIANFGNPSFLNTYAKLVPSSPSNCNVEGPFSENEFALVYLSYTCNLQYLAQTAQNSGASGVIMVWNDDFSEGLIYALDYLEVDLNVYIVAFVITQSLGKTLKEYADKEIIIRYKYADLPSKINPSINIMLTSDYTIDLLFIKSLSDLIERRDGYFYLSDVSLIASSLELETNSTEECVFYDEKNFVCVQSSDTVTGSEKLKNTAVIINYFNTLTDVSMLDTFFSYLFDLYNTCANNYTIECNKNVLLKYGTFNEDVSSLINNYPFKKIIPKVQIEGVNIFWNNYIKDAYCFSKLTDSTMCGSYTGTDICSYLMLTDNICNNVCNNIENNYDNLKCSKIGTCYSFLLNNGQCENSCPDDPDCSSKNEDESGDDLLLVKILVPIFGCLLLVTLGFVYLFFCKHRRRREPPAELSLTGNANINSYKKETFNEQLRGNRDNKCTLCSAAIEVNDECITIISGCTHFFHSKCFMNEISRRNNYCCPQCNQDPMPSIINPHEPEVILDNRK